MKPRLAQLAQSGATVGEIPEWNGTVWAPASIATTSCRSVLTATGGEDVLHIGVTPAANTDQLFVNGLLLTPGVGYTLSGSTATLTTALSAGDHLVVSYLTASSCGVASLAEQAHGFRYPTPLRRPVRRLHRIR